MEPSTTAITSKLTALLRLGLVSRNNVNRAINVFKNPERAMKSSANRTLMQEILMDIVDRIINNKSLYNMIRQNISKDNHNSPVADVYEGVSDERIKTLFRSGLVKKKDVMLARRAVSNKNNLKSMAAVGVYREMMISLLDSMVKKITGNPVLFNAFKRTLGKEEVEESFVSPNVASIIEFSLDVDGTSLLESNKPTDYSLWVRAKTISKNKFPDSFVECTTACAIKWYNENGGEWKPIADGKNFFEFISNVDKVNEMSEPNLKKYDKIKGNGHIPL